MKLDLFKKKVLYLGPISFGYDQFLINKLRVLGCIVTAFELNITGLEYKLINKFRPSHIASFEGKYYDKMLKIKGYDYVIVRQGFQLSDSFYKKLRALNPNAQLINFHWDSLKDSYNYEPLIKCFDNVYSFDYKDCSNNTKIKYLPLFFIDEYFDFFNCENLEPVFDILFIGAWRNMERYEQIRYTKNLCQTHNLKFYYYLYLSFRRQYWALKAGQIPRSAKSRQLSHHEISRLFSRSNTIIDFPSSFQSGLTIRTFEALAAGKKLITTNRNIIKEPFYDPEFVNILEKKDFKLDIDFIKSKPSGGIKEKIKSYSIENYIYKLLQ